MKMKSMKEAKADKEAEATAMGQRGNGAYEQPDNEGVDVHLEHHHLAKLQMTEPLDHGTPVSLQGDGHVKEWHTSEGPDGEPRHRATITMTRLGAEHDAATDDRGGLRGDIKTITDASEGARANRAAARGAAAERTDAKIPEQAKG